MGMTIEIGKRAPMFTLPSSEGGKFALKDHSEQYVVVYFYPKDNTPGCTTEAQDFRNAQSRLAELNTTVVGISKDSIESHCKFVAKQELNFALLTDEEGNVMEKYGAWGLKKLYGREFMGVIRSTFIVGPGGKIVEAYPKVRVKGHVDKVLAAIEAHACS